MRNIWEILGIDATTDKKEIKKAYAKKTKEFHPKDNPEEFQIIQEAYKMAINYAKNSKGRIKNIQDDKINDDIKLNKGIKIENRDELIKSEYRNLSEKDFKSEDYTEKNEKYRKIIISEELEELKYERENSEKKIDIDYEELARQFEKNRKEDGIDDQDIEYEYEEGIFNNINQDGDSEEELRHMNYFLNYVEKKIPNKINMEMFTSLLSNSYIKSYIQNYEFKYRFEEIMLNKSYADTLYTEKKMAEIARENNLYKVAREIEKNTKRRYIGGIRTPAFILWMIIIAVTVNIFLKDENEEKNSRISKNISQNIVNTDEQMYRIKESLLKTNLLMNEKSINGYNIEVDESGYYIIKNKKGDLVQDKVTLIEFTLSPSIISKKEKLYYIINTDTEDIVKTRYKKIKSVYILENESKRRGLAALKRDKWYVIDNRGRRLKEIKGTKKGNMFDVLVDKNGRATFSED